MKTDPPAIALTFDDVLIVPAFSDVHPNSVDLKTELCRGITMNIPIVAAAMDTRIVAFSVERETSRSKFPRLVTFQKVLLVFSRNSSRRTFDERRASMTWSRGCMSRG